MPTSGLVVTLSADPEQAAAARRRIDADPRFELGPAPQGGHDPCPRHPAVLEAPTGDACESAVRELQAAPGVELVDIVSVDLSDLTHPTPSIDPTRSEIRP